MITSFTILIENRTEINGLLAEDGLSIFIQLPHKHILFDTGASDFFARNASKMEIELFGADAIIISHGHHDHSGGLSKALAEASNAELFISPDSMTPHYSLKNGRKNYIGIPDSAKSAVKLAGDFGRVHWCAKKTYVSKNTEIITNSGLKQCPDNWIFFEETERNILDHDHFSHEIFLLITGEHSSCLVIGGSHIGINKIIKQVSKECKRPLKYIIGGIHTLASSSNELQQIASSLHKNEISAYLGHCTGINAFCELYRLYPQTFFPIITGMSFSIDI